MLEQGPVLFSFSLASHLKPLESIFEHILIPEFVDVVLPVLVDVLAILVLVLVPAVLVVSLEKLYVVLAMLGVVLSVFFGVLDVDTTVLSMTTVVLVLARSCSVVVLPIGLVG